MEWNQPKRHDGAVTQTSSDPAGYSITAMRMEKDKDKLVYLASFREESFARLYDVDAKNVEGAKAASAAMRVICGSHAIARGYKPRSR